MLKKLRDTQDKLDAWLIAFFKKQKKHILLIVKVFILMLITSFIAGFVNPNVVEDYLWAFVYIVIIAIFLFFIPFERLFFPNQYSRIVENKKSKKKD